MKNTYAASKQRGGEGENFFAQGSNLSLKNRTERETPPETGTSAEAVAEPGWGIWAIRPDCLPAWHNGIQGMHQAKKTKKKK